MITIKIFGRLLVLLLLIVFVLSNAEIHSVGGKKIVPLFYDDYKHPYPEKCSELIDVFAGYASNFTLCSMKYARPIRLCENCVNHYVKFRAMYKELGDTIINGTSCLSLFISQDRLNAIQEYHDHIMTVWEKGHCSDCFDWSEDIPSIKNNTLKFYKMFIDTMDCITNNMNKFENNTQEICLSCMNLYVGLDDFYKSLSKDSIGVDSICMDIVDSMNTSRAIWSKSLHCCDIRKTPELMFLCCTGIISLLPLLFYVAVRYCRPIRDLHNVLNESRFKQSILRSIQGRIN